MPEEMPVSDFLEELVLLVNKKFDSQNSKIKMLEAGVNELRLENSRLKDRLALLEKRAEQKPVDIIRKDLLRTLE